MLFRRGTTEQTPAPPQRGEGEKEEKEDILVGVFRLEGLRAFSFITGC